MCCCSSSSSSPPPAPGTGATPACASAAPCAVAVTVKIQLSQPVGCPGHPLQIDAVGTPGGGAYAWTVSGAQLVDGAGNPISAGPTVFLRGFKADDATGKIPEQTATVGVTYTHPNGSATDSKPVKIHKIDFEVTDTTITAGTTDATETGGFAQLGGQLNSTQTMVTDPKVKIKLDALCPRKTDCATNHRVGWLQTVISVDRRIRYTHTLIQTTKSQPLPLRDGDPFAGPSPHPFYDAAPDFTADNDTQTAHHFDTPGLAGNWTDPRPTAPAPPPAKNQQLRQMFFQIGFHAWLVVQNKEWSKHDVPGSFAYQKHFDWDTHLDVTVDTTQPVGSRCSPQTVVPTISAMAEGKGGASPSLMNACSNDLNVTTTTPAPGI